MPTSNPNPTSSKKQSHNSSIQPATIPVVRLPRRLEKVFCLFANESRSYIQKELCRILKLPKYTVSRYVKTLVKKGLLMEEISGRTRFYKLTFEGKTYCNTFFTGGSGRGVRSHNIMFSSHILRKPRSWVLDNSWRVVSVRNWKKYIGDGFEGLRVEITPRRVLFFVNELFGGSADENLLVAGKLVSKALFQLSNDFPELVLGKPGNNFSVCKQHHALVEHSLTRKFPSDFNIVLDRVSFDHSKGVGELEAHDNKYSQDDSVKIMAFTDKLVSGGYDFEALNRLGGLDVVLGRLAVAFERSVEVQNRILETQSRILEVQSMLLERSNGEIAGKPSPARGLGWENVFNGT